MTKMKVALLGGSFNPVHNGHLNIANLCLEKKLVDEVWFVPCSKHSFDKSLVDVNYRIEMLKLGFEDFRVKYGMRNFKVEDLETKRVGKSYTYDTLRDLREKYGQELDFYLIIGSDNIGSIEKWNNFEKLRIETKFIIVSRPGYVFENSKNLSIYANVEANFCESSTEVRKRIEQKQSIVDLVSPQIEKYIFEMGLYK